MRRLVLLGWAAGTAAITACEGLRDAFSPQANMVAVAAGRRLPTERVVGLLGQLPGIPQPEAAALIADLWVDLHLFAQARLNDALAPDSALVARVMWPQILQDRMQAWQESLTTRRPRPVEASADSAYQAGSVRLFQHIIVVPEGGSARDSANARARIGGLLAQVRRGGDFGALARQNTDASREDQGFLPVGGRGQFVGEFEEAAWELDAGEVSDVVQTSFGFHLIRRTPVEEARPRFLEYLHGNNDRQQDSLYIATLTQTFNVQPQANAPQLIKDASQDLDAARRSNRRIATWRGGALTVADLARWMEALQPGASRQLLTLPDSVLKDFAENLAVNQLVVRQMDSAGIVPAMATWQALNLALRSTLEQWAEAIGLSDSVIIDTTLAVAEREDSAAARVENFLDQLVAGEAQYRPFPTPLGSWLRDRGRYRINRAGIARALELATAQARADSAAAAQAPPVGPIQPAPGGPPIPQPDSVP